MALVPCASYDTALVRAALQEGLARLGGLGRFAQPGQRALLKINLLGPRGADLAVTTHPAVALALAEEFRRAQVSVVVGDSPGVGDFDRAAAVAGLRDHFQQVELEDFQRASRVAVANPSRVAAFELFDGLGRFDLLVDVPKLKGHAFQVLSCAVKNLFGLVPGRRKEEFHVRFPEPDAFGEMLLDLYRATRPGLCVVDAIDVPLGDRPGARGGIRRLGLLALSDDAVAVDAALAQVLAMAADGVPVLRAARRRGLPGADLSKVDVVGGIPPGFALGAPARVEPATQLPRCDSARCTGCGTCRDICPTGAVSMVAGAPRFDERACIRCYCCAEFCGERAIAAESTPAMPAPIAAVAAPEIAAVPEPRERARIGPPEGINLVLPPPFGLRGHRVSLGAAYLCGALRQAGMPVAFLDVNARCEAEEPALFSALEERGMPNPDGGLYAPDPRLLLEALFPEAFDACSPLARRISESAGARARELGGEGVFLVSAQDANLPYALALAAHLTRAGAQVALGGPAITMHADVRDLALRARAARALFMGEADGAVPALVRALRARAGDAELEALPGVMIREGRAPAPAEREDLGGEPRPDFDGMRLQGWLPVQASRGCPRRCSFCSEPAAVRRFRRRSPADVVAEMKRGAERYGVRTFEFSDDLLNADPAWLDALARALRGSGFEWGGFMEPAPTAPQLFADLFAAGCRALTFGAQSFNPDVLRRMHRRPSLSEIREPILAAARAGIAVQLDVLVGHPGEGRAQFEDTARAVEALLSESPDLEVNLNPFQVVPGADIARRPGDHGVALSPAQVELPSRLASFSDLVGRFVGAARCEPSSGEVRTRTADLARRIARRNTPRPVPILNEELPRCNNHCVFCGVADLRPRARVAPLEEIERALAGLAATGEDRVMFAVSELSLRPDFLRILAAARREGFRAVYVVTNGRVFAYPELAARAVGAGATHFMVSIHGHDARCHDSLTRTPGSWSQTAAGIRHLVGAGACVATNTVVTRANLGSLTAVLDLVADLGARYATLSLVQIIGEAARHPERLVVPLSAAAPALIVAAQHGETRGLRVGLGGVPYCLAVGSERFIGVDDRSAIFNADPRDNITSKAPYAHPPECLECARCAICPGLAAEYLQRFGSAELRPIHGRREVHRPPCPAAEFVVEPRDRRSEREAKESIGLGGRRELQADSTASDRRS